MPFIIAIISTLLLTEPALALEPCQTDGQSFHFGTDQQAAEQACLAASTTGGCYQSGNRYLCNGAGSNDSGSNSYNWDDPTNSCIPAAGDTHYDDSADALNACTAQCVTGQPSGSQCLLIQESSTKHYWRLRFNNQNGTAFLFNPQQTCPQGQSVNPSTGQCEDLNPSNDPIGTCEQEGVNFMQGIVNLPFAPGAQQTFFDLDLSVGGTVTTVDEDSYVCAKIPGYVNTAEEDLECKIKVSKRQSITAELQLTETQTILGAPYETVIANDVQCGTTETINQQQYDASDFGKYKYEEDQSGQQTEEICWNTSSYDSNRGTTQVCTVCETLIDGVSQGQSTSCQYEAGDSTSEGSGGTTQVDSNGNPVSGGGSSGSNTNFGGTGQVDTNSDGVSDGSGSGAASGDNADVVDAIDRLADQLSEEEGEEPCTEEGGCEDFEEIKEDYDGSADNQSITDAWNTIVTALSDEETELTDLSNDPSSITSSVDEGELSTFPDLFPTGGSCTDFVIPFAQGDAVIPCSDLETLKAILTVFTWLYVLIHIRNVFFRPVSAS